MTRKQKRVIRKIKEIICIIASGIVFFGGMFLPLLVYAYMFPNG